ncbi:hypothetical protein [Amycolatopsis sp.]|uniref:hypothetical protein n=1 Tax=Amycolatopsis sp. TaxID=37632 RepID=UPI002D8048EC|nr:hypothetical protein [Amycolatopsis sp.]
MENEKSSNIDVSPGPKSDWLYAIGPGVKLARLPVMAADRSSCDQAVAGSSESTNRGVRLYGLRVGQVICVLTDEHRISVLTSVKVPSSAPGDDKATFAYVTYS